MFLLLTSCGKKVLIDETHEFNNNCWLRFEPETFMFDVNDTDKSKCVSVTLRYDTSLYTNEVLPLVVDFFIDSTEKHNIAPSIRLRDAKGMLRGTAIGKFCTVTDTIDSRRIYNAQGRYTYKIKQRTSKFEIYGISSLNFKVVDN